MLQTSAAVPGRILGAPPRRPPASLKVRVALSWSTLIALTAVGLFGGVFSSCTLPGIVHETRIMAGGVRAPGTLISVEETHTTINEKRVFVHHFRFEHEGQQYQGSSYSYDASGPQSGAVSVELVPSSPGVSRIVGQRTTLLPLSGGLFVAGILLVALVGFAGAFRRSLGHVRLLVHGVEGRALLVEQRRQMNKGTVVGYELAYVFEDRRGRTQELHLSTRDPRVLTDEEEEPILYHPLAPERAALLDELPGRPRIDERGELIDSAPGALVPRLLLASLAVCGLVLGLVSGFG